MNPENTDTKKEECHQLFSFIVENIDDIYIQITKDLLITYINPSTLKHFRLASVTKIIGTSISKIFLFSDEWTMFWNSISVQKNLVDYCAFMKRNDGTFFIGSIAFHQVFNHLTPDICFEGCIHDTTTAWLNTVFADNKQNDIKSLCNTDKSGIWVYDCQDDLLFGSEQFYSICGLKTGEKNLTLEDLLSCFQPSDHAQVADLISRVTNTNSFIFQGAFISQNIEQMRYFLLKGKIYPNKTRSTRVIGLIHDITEQKKDEQYFLKYATESEQKNRELDTFRFQLLNMNRDLEQRINSRTRQIELLLNQKDEFIIQIGHDIRTPLTPLVAILPLLKKRITDPESQKLLDIAISDVQSIKKLVNQILALAQQNSLYTLSDITPINVSIEIEKIITNHSYLIHQKSLLIQNSIPSSITIEMSPLHFEAIFDNIIGNAVKFSYINGTIEITGSSLQKNNGFEILIRDDGIGIQTEEIPYIFDEFYKGDKSRHERDSYGLGLSIVYRIIQMYNGKITIASDGPGKGTTLTVHLPLTINQ